MIFIAQLDTPRVRAYLDSVADGLNKSPAEIIASLGGVAALLLVLLFFALWWRKKEAQKRQEKSEAAFSAQSERLKLTFSDIELLKRLSDATSEGRLGLSGLAKNQQYFNIAVKKALKKGIVQDSEIAALRFRLGHVTDNTRGILSSTAFLKPGTAVEIRAEKRSEYGSVVEVTPAKFSVRLLSEIKITGLVELRFARPTGIYSCRRRVLRYQKGIAEFRHTETISRSQKRSSLRKRILMSVSIESEASRVTGKLVDLSEGGARISCPSEPFEIEQAVTVILFKKTSEPVNVTARIVRIERDPDFIGLQFLKINDRIRERIVNTVFH